MKPLDRLTVFAHETWTKPVGRAGAYLLIAASVIALGGFIVTHTFLAHVPLLGSLANDFYANLSTELLSIAITVLIIDTLVERRQNADKKAELIRDLGSKTNDFAQRAARELRARGWHRDGSLRGAWLEEANLTSAILSGADLTDAVLVGTNLTDVDLEGANLMDVRMWRANLTDARLADANLTNVDLRKANLKNTKLMNVDLSDAKLMNVNLSGAILVKTDLMNAFLEGANLTNAILVEVNFTSACYNNDTKWPEG